MMNYTQTDRFVQESALFLVTLGPRLPSEYPRLSRIAFPLSNHRTQVLFVPSLVG